MLRSCPAEARESPSPIERAIANPPSGSSGAEFSVAAAGSSEVRRIILANDGYLIDPRTALGDEATNLLIMTTTGHETADVEFESFLIDRFRTTG